MRREQCNLTILNKSFIKNLTELNWVIKFTNTVIFSAFIVFKNQNVFYFLVPDWKMDCSRSSTDSILCATTYSWFKLFKERNNASVLNFSASDFRIDTPDATCVDTNSCSLRNIPTNCHITTEDTVKGVVNINKNTRCKLAKWGSNTCHDWRRNVDFVFGDCVIIPLDVWHSDFFWILCKDSQSNHHIHELWRFIYSTTTTILNQIFINYLT